MTDTTRPLILVPACSRQLGEHPFQICGQKYLDAVRLAGGLPLVVPGTDAEGLAQLLDLADGVFLTGSPSNVHPSHFGEAVHDTSLPLDPARDAWTLPLIPQAIARGIPLFAICRGTQETNVAFGGSLHQAVHEVAGHQDHRAPADQPAAVQYGPSHEVIAEPGGLLATLVGTGRFAVNSVHGQAVNQLAPGLRVEARAPDGVIEAFSVADAPAFNLCVQWHPEWRAADNDISKKMLTAFGEACRRYREGRRGPHP